MIFKKKIKMDFKKKTPSGILGIGFKENSLMDFKKKMQMDFKELNFKQMDFLKYWFLRK